MTELKMQSPGGHTIFCDDIRSELGGKLSFMGVYQGYMYLPQIPITLPKFCLNVTYHEDFDAEIPDLILEIYIPGDEDNVPSLSQSISSPKTLPERPPETHFGDNSKVGFVFPVQFAPLEIKTEGQIRVRMLRGDDVVRLGTLYATLAPNGI